MLELVTITGADNQTSLDGISEISKEYPFVEWGILISASQMEHARFPGYAWISKFIERALIEGWSVSTHLCGSWVRQLLKGQLDLSMLPLDLLRATGRIQINTHAEEHVSTVGFIRTLSQLVGQSVRTDLQFIFQWDGVNDHLAFAAKSYGLNVCALFDTSHGAGRLPFEWPRTARDFWCGYAGGLGPDNIADELPKIEQANTWPGTVLARDYWIDMERRVRTDQEVLDIGKVRTVLDICKAHRGKTIGKVIQEQINRG